MNFADPVQNVQAFGFNGAMKIADFGAGSGAYALVLASRLRDNGKIFAIDVQKELLAKLALEARRRHLTNIETIWGDVEKPLGTKLRDAELDGVLISNLLFQTKAAYSVILEAKRILRPGGVAVIIDWTDSFSGLGPSPADIITAVKAEQIFNEAGFKKIGEFSAGPHHWGRRFQKAS